MWSSPVAVILKAIGFHLATIEALYRARLSAGDPIRDDLTRTKAEFIALSRPTAERIVRFIAREDWSSSPLGGRERAVRRSRSTT